MENVEKILNSMSLIEGMFQEQENIDLKKVSSLMSKILKSDVIILNREGNLIEDYSTIRNEEADYYDFYSANKDLANLSMQTSFNYEWEGLYSITKPLFCSGSKKGVVMFTKSDKFTYEELILVEHIALSVSIVLQLEDNSENSKDKEEREAIDLALRILSYTEQEAIKKILEKMDGEEGIIIASALSKETNITRSIIVNAIKKLEGSGVLLSKSLGMKGTYIKISNSYLRQAVNNL